MIKELIEPVIDGIKEGIRLAVNLVIVPIRSLYDVFVAFINRN